MIVPSKYLVFSFEIVMASNMREIKLPCHLPIFLVDRDTGGLNKSKNSMELSIQGKFC